MKPYLQRLYDAAIPTATAPGSAAVEARPAQRSSSPLLAVDQRLASPSYAASFLLGLPGAPDPDAAPAPEPDLLTLPPPGHRDRAPATDEGAVRPPAPRPVPPAAPEPAAERRVVPRSGPVTTPDPVVPPATTRHESAAAPTAAAHAAVPTVEAAPPVAEDRTRPVVAPAPRPHAVAPETIEPSPVSRVDAPTRATQPDQLRAAPEPPPTTSPSRPRPEGVSPPPMVRPAPRPAAEPLPPPPLAPRGAEPAELADQVRRLVREAMAGGDTPRRTSRDERDGPAEVPAATAAPGRTAEAMSVIGPLDRPARATTLYGLRLR